MGLLILLFCFLNLPFSQRAATRQVNRILSRADLPIRIDAIRKLLPGSVILQGFAIDGTNGESIIYAGEIEADIRLVALIRSKVVVRDLKLDGAVVDIGRESETGELNIVSAFQAVNNMPADPAEEEVPAWEISVNRAGLTNIKFGMTDSLAGMHISQFASEIKVSNLRIALSDQEVFCRSLELVNTEGYLSLTPRLMEINDQTGEPWTLGLHELSLNDIDFDFRQPADSLEVEVRIGKGDIRANELDLTSMTVDLSRIDIRDGRVAYLPGRQDHSTLLPGSMLRGIIEGIDLNIKDLRIDKETADMVVKRLNFEMDNGFSLKRMKGELASGNEQTRLDLELETGKSSLGLEGYADAGLFEILSDPAVLDSALVKMDRTVISLKDISLFDTALSEIPAYALFSSDPILLDGRLQFANSAITTPGFIISLGDHFLTDLKGTVENPFHLTSATGDMELVISDLDRILLERLMNVYGMDFSIPDLSDVKIRAGIKDSILSPVVSLSLTGPLGNVNLDGTVDFQRERFSLDYAVNDLSLGDILQIDEMGYLTGRGEMKGSGFSGSVINTDFFLQVDTFEFKDYQYAGMLFAGSVSPGSYRLNMVATDPSLKADLDLSMTMADSVFTVDASGEIMARLDSMHFYQDTLAIESAVEAHLEAGEGEVESEFTASNILYTNSRGTAFIDQLNTTLRSDSLSSILHADAGFFNLDLQFMQPFSELDSLGRQYKSYFASLRDPSHLTAADRLTGLPEMNATGQLSRHPFLELLTGDSGIHFTTLDLTINSRPEKNTLQAEVRGDAFSYKSLKTGRFNAGVTDSAGIMLVGLDVERLSVQSGPEYRASVNGQFSNRSTLTTVSINDYLNQPVYFIEVEGRVDSNQVVLEIPSQQLTLNRVRWQTEGPGLLSIDLGTGAPYPVLKLKNDSSFIHFNTSENDRFLTYLVDLNRVDLASLIRRGLIQGRPDATISGSIEYSTGMEVGKKITSGLQLENIRYYEQDFDDIRLDGSLSIGMSDEYSIDLEATMNDSDFKIKGEKKENGERSVDASFNHFPLITIQPFTREYVSDLGGFISGKLNISNGREGEKSEGELDFKDARVKVNLLNSSFRIPSQRVLLADNRLVFNNFTVLDTLNKALKVDGYVDIGRDQPVTADLNISSSKLRVMSRDEATTAPFTGNVFVDSRFSVRGPLIKPVIEGRIQLSEGTEIFYQYKEELRVPESERLVSFTGNVVADEGINPPAIRRQSALLNSSIQTIVGIDPATRINFTLDNRMFKIDLDVKGGGQVQYNMMRNEQVTLSGRYVIGEGSALLHLVGWPNKSFTISEGGYIRWDGRVENPELRFEAENRVFTSYLNPVDNRRRDIEFNVILQISGYLSDLNVLFTIRTPDQYVMSVINTMSPEEKMRQAIQVLLFETIDLPGISSSTDYMTQQVNQILASQLNQLTKSTIKGVDISFGLDTYDGSSMQGGGESSTSLSYEVKKSLLNNRGVIEVSGRLHDVNQQPGVSDHSLNNVSFEYRLDSASTKYLKVYNEHTYEDVFDGEVVKTGIGFTYRKRYRTFRDIWRRRK